MKISIVTSHLTKYIGASKTILDYSNEFLKYGIDITIVAQKIDKTIFNFDNGVKLIEIEGPLPKSIFHWLLFNKIKKRYLNALSEEGSDIIYTDQFPTNYYCSCLNRRHSRKLIYYCHEPYRYFHDKLFYSNSPFLMKILSTFLRYFFKKFDIIGAKRADLIIANSKFTKNRIKKVYGRDSIIHNPCPKIEYGDLSTENKFEKIFNLKSLNSYIFALSLTHQLKGAKELIIIFSLILKKEPNVILLIGGNLTNQNYKIIKKMQEKLRIPKEKIFFLGFIDNKLLKKIYEKVDLTLYTPIDEAFGLIPIESQYNRTPVIAFEGGPSETIINNKTGFVIEKNNIIDFSEKSLLLLKDKDKNKQFGLNGRKHIRENFNFEESVEKIISIIKKSISESIK